MMAIRWYLELEVEVIVMVMCVLCEMNVLGMTSRKWMLIF